jgi:Tat protein secretion system quality control protein TatD with DNase activity
MFVSQDQVLHRSIRKSILEQPKFLDAIGTSQLQQEEQRKILTAAKKASKVIQETGVEPSMSEDDMKDYLRMVVEEIQGARESSGK